MVLVNKGATALNLNEIASLSSKLEDRSRSFSQNLMLAGQFSGKDLSSELQASLEQVSHGATLVTGAGQCHCSAHCAFGKTTKFDKSQTLAGLSNIWTA